MSNGGLGVLLGQMKRSFWLYFGGIWLLVGVIMLIVAIGMAVEERRWAAAVRTTGMVLTKDIVPADSDSSTQYRITFRYATDDGRTAEGDQQVDVSTWEALTERGPVDVFYLPGSAESARLDASPQPVGPILFFVIGAVVGGIGGVLFGRALRGLIRTRRVMRMGVDAEATVTAVEQTDVSFNRRPQFRVRYRYRDAGGAPHEGDSGYLDWEEASTFGEGDVVTIRYDPRHPVDSVWIGRPPAPVETPEPISEGARQR
jgi:hypothetical protein